jgi:Protein of unknown function (DUF3667)
MSQHKLRKDSNCLNCGQLVEKHFCSNCGQENREPYESVWGFTTHFVADILHWDGKFFRTIKKLFVNPGGLSADYVAGKRAAFVVPIRMYLICSVAFGLAFSFHMKNFSKTKNQENRKGAVELDIVDINLSDSDTTDRTLINTAKKRNELLNNPKALREFDWRDSVTKSNPTTVVINPRDGNITGDLGWSTGGKLLVPYGITVQNMDSAIRESKKVVGARLNYEYEMQYMLVRYFAQKKAAHPDGNMNLNKAVEEELIHTLPKSFFILMPFFAFILYLLYYRRKYYYYQHMVFTLHYYCVALLVYGIMPFISRYLIKGNTIPAIAVIGMSVYLFIALKKFYKQSYGKTLLKFCLLSAANIFALMLTILTIVILGLYHA